VSLRGAALLALLLAGGTAAAEEAATPPRAVVVGGDRDYPPYEFLDADGRPAGFNVDLTRAIAEVMGMRVEFRLGDWHDVRTALERGRIDALQGMSHSEARAAVVDFAPPSTVVNHAIFARDGTPPVSGLAELRGHKVALHQAGIMDDTLTRMGYGADLLRTDTPADALRMLSSGRAEYAVVAILPGTYITRQFKLTNVHPVARGVASQHYGLAVRKGNSELLSRFTEGLAILKQTGRYEEIRHRWLGVLEPTPVDWITFLRFGAVLVFPFVIVLGGTFLWTRSLQREVAQRTASLAREVAERQRAVEELRLNQAQLVQADKMAALGVLVSGVAHEINNPNGQILLNMPVLKDVYLDAREVLERHWREDPGFTLGGLPYSRMREELPGMLDEMLEGARRIKRIVEDLKDFARREDAPRHEPVDLDAVVRAALRLVDPSIQKATHRFETSLAPGLPRVLGNAQRIEQVVVNLVLNACQALPSPDRAVRVTTRVGAGDDASPRRGPWVQIVVEDEGVGIPADHLPRLADPFFTTKRDSGGTGLGLSVSAGIVKEHGGTLDFRSTPGAGTTVVLTLPAMEPEEAP
jgi:polar amino acid transport system substrate-binding protein